ncbi:MAG TPA: ADP-forming succinate--CoA ligase subunit beta [Desulfobacteria bacterium]|nr:ADP-forming succinate--CoA ligase subunit beta [Desulfobacteria bacterium]
MKLFEFMGKEIFSQNGIKVPSGKIAYNSDEAAAVAAELGEVVLKSQMLFGGRGKAGGIKFAKGEVEARACADELFATELKGQKIERLLVEQKIRIDKEIYISIALDGSKKQPVLIASAEGGVDIEEVPQEKIIKKHIDPEVGVLPHFCREVVRRLGLTGALGTQATDLISKLYSVFKKYDCELVEINPLVISGEELIAADSKMNIDDEAQFRFPVGTPNVEERTALEKKAHDIGIAYVELEGDIAVMANGAGITMATLDIIQHFGGSASNFMDAGGGADSEATAQALEILISTKPKVILINIFGGITRCDDVARAFIKVKESMGIPVPVAIRLSGTNEEEGIKMLGEIGIPCYNNIRDAAAKAVEIAKAG